MNVRKCVNDKYDKFVKSFFIYFGLLSDFLSKSYENDKDIFDKLIKVLHTSDKIKFSICNFHIKLL